MGRPNPGDRINRKQEDLKNDKRTNNAKNGKTEKITSTVLNLIFGQFNLVNFDMLMENAKTFTIHVMEMAWTGPHF